MLDISATGFVIAGVPENQKHISHLVYRHESQVDLLTLLAKWKIRRFCRTVLLGLRFSSMMTTLSLNLLSAYVS